jgi:hypothetical protein
VLLGLPGQPPQVLQAALVGLDGEGPAAGLGDLTDHGLGGGLVLQVAEHHRGAVGGQSPHDRPAYPS